VREREGEEGSNKRAGAVEEGGRKVLEDEEYGTGASLQGKFHKD
jgi:hypothetical protein